MAWKETLVFEQRKSFIEDYFSDLYSITDLCKKYEISRPTAYTWIERFKTGDEAALHDRRSTPLNQPFTTPGYIVDEILSLKYQWREWGPKKIEGHLKNHRPDLILPSLTTIGNILNRNGLVERREFRIRFANRTQPLAHAKDINDVWSVDFKGWTLTSDKQKCEPFTLTDNASRYLLKCMMLDFNNTESVWAILDMAFREYGLPLYLRSDNGAPFASRGPGRLSKISVKLIKAGVLPDFIDPGKPEQNGRHERMHGTLKSEGIFPELSLVEQKRKLKDFQHYYNNIRPHEGINQVTPASIYNISERVWTGKFRSPDYPENYEKRKVRPSGQIKLSGQDVFIGTVLAGEYIGLEEIQNGYKIYYGPFYLGNINKKNEFEIPRRAGRDRNKKVKLEFY
jgi:putative transposase